MQSSEHHLLLAECVFCHNTIKSVQFQLNYLSWFCCSVLDTVRNLFRVRKNILALSELCWWWLEVGMGGNGWGWVGKYPTLVGFSCGNSWMCLPLPSAWSHTVHIHMCFASSLCFPECLCPMPPVRTCPQVILAVPAFLLQRAPPCPAPPSWIFELLLSHQWGSRSIPSHVGESCDKVSQALQPQCSTFDALPRSFLLFIFIFLFLLPLLSS